jgi:hypothetical protein
VSKRTPLPPTVAGDYRMFMANTSI